MHSSYSQLKFISSWLKKSVHPRLELTTLLYRVLVLSVIVQAISHSKNTASKIHYVTSIRTSLTHFAKYRQCKLNFLQHTPGPLSFCKFKSSKLFRLTLNTNLFIRLSGFCGWKNILTPKLLSSHLKALRGCLHGQFSAHLFVYGNVARYHTHLWNVVSDSRIVVVNMLGTVYQIINKM